MRDGNITTLYQTKQGIFHDRIIFSTLFKKCGFGPDKKMIQKEIIVATYV